MADRLRALLQRFLEWWGRFSAKQKTVIISAVAVVVVSVSIAAWVFTRPTMITLVTATSAEQSSSIQTLLTDNNIEFIRSDDGMTYSVNKNMEADARILLGTNDIPTDGFSINDVVDGSFSTTEADKKKKYQVYLEQKFETDLESLSTVKEARVNLKIPEDDGTLIANQEPTYANVVLHLTDSMDSDQAAGLAKYMSTALGNETSAYISIIDSDGNMLFSGGDEVSGSGIASSNQKVKQEAERIAASKVRTILAGSGNGNVYDNVEIGINLDMNFNDSSYVDYHYYLDEGQTQGYLDSRHEAKTESTNGVSGIPGTDSNDDTTYVLQDNQYSSSSSSEIDEDYLPSERITTVNGEVGVVDYTASTITVVAYNYVTYDEDLLKADGSLDDKTFEQYIAENSANVQTEVPEDVINAIASATRIPVENISVLAYDVPMFNYSESLRDWTDYLQIALAVLIIAMLGFVVFRTLRKEEEEEVEAEVSVEQLMEEEESNLDAVRYTEKSEARLMIEKFVEERPEAVAQLLRNWLNEEWGE